MFRFTIRDVRWLTMLIAALVGWWVDHRINSAEQVTRRTEQRVLQWLGKNTYWVRKFGGRHMSHPLPPTMDWDEWVAEGKRIANIEPVLRELLAKRNARVDLAQIAECLGALGNSDTVPVLIDCLASEQMLLRMEAAVALGRLGDKRAVEPLGKILTTDWSENVRANAVEALDHIGGDDSIRHIETAMRDESRFVAEIANEALAAYRNGARW